MLTCSIIHIVILVFVHMYESDQISSAKWPHAGEKTLLTVNVNSFFFKPARSFGSKTANVTGITSISGKIHCNCASCFYCKWLMVNANIGAESECCVQNPHWARLFPHSSLLPHNNLLELTKMFTLVIIEELL